MMRTPSVCCVTICFLTICFLTTGARGDHPQAAPGITSLTDKSITYSVPKDIHFVLVRRGDITAVVVDNNAVDHPVLPGHRAGYNGLASLTHVDRGDNLFVPFYAGLNFEHIHDGTLAVAKEPFEPRRNPMELRIIDEHTVELYQAPTKNWHLESCGRYHLLADGTIEYTFECVPHEDCFSNGYIGLFWASYINRPSDKAIYFKGSKRASESGPATWIRADSPRHGIDSTHPPSGELPPLNIPADFPLTLINHLSAYQYSAPWYYGISHEMAFVQMFRRQDRIWFAQSPSGGGRGNPAWDFQWFVFNYKVGEAYGFVMRAGYLPFDSREQLSAWVRPHLEQMARQE